MIYLHPACCVSPEHVQAVQAATGLTAVINVDGQAILRPPTSSSGREHKAAPSPIAPGHVSPGSDTAAGAVGVFYRHKEDTHAN